MSTLRGLYHADDYVDEYDNYEWDEEDYVDDYDEEYDDEDYDDDIWDW